MPPTVVVRNLSKRYGRVEAVRGMDFEVGAGEIFGLLGPNGAGKTTTLECLTGLREPDAGELMVGGVDVRRQRRQAQQKMGVAMQHTALPAQITPREALALFGALYRERTAPGELLERFALTAQADTRFHALSGGQQQRLALALAFVNRPGLVLLDEPTAGLDPSARRELHGEIVRMKREGHTVLLATHYLEEAEQLCDRIAIMVRGRIVALGTPSELIARSSARQTVRLVSSPPLEPGRLARLAGVEDLQCDGGLARFRTGQATVTLAAVAAALAAQGCELIDLQVGKASLEEVFLGLAGGEEVDRTTAP